MAAGPVSDFSEMTFTEEDGRNNQIDGEILLSDSDEEDEGDVPITAFQVRKPDADTAVDSCDVYSSHGGSQMSGFSSEDFGEETTAI